MGAHLRAALGENAELLALDRPTQLEFARAALAYAKHLADFDGDPCRIAKIHDAGVSYGLAYLRATETVAELVEAGGE
jgi:hypothetical protein